MTSGSQPGRFSRSDLTGNLGAPMIVLGGAGIGGAITTLLLTWLVPHWAPAADPEVAQAIETLVNAAVTSLATFGSGVMTLAPTPIYGHDAEGRHAKEARLIPRVSISRGPSRQLQEGGRTA